MEFIDDYNLLIRLEKTVDRPPSIVLMDTRRDIRGTPMKTVFHLPRRFGGLYLTLERGGHKPSPVESLAPFHQDPNQRIVVLDTNSYLHYLVVQVAVFLELFKDREGTEIG